MALDDVELEFSNDALNAIVDKAMERKNRCKRTTFYNGRNYERCYV